MIELLRHDLRDELTNLETATTDREESAAREILRLEAEVGRLRILAEIGVQAEQHAEAAEAEVERLKNESAKWRGLSDDWQARAGGAESDLDELIKAFMHTHKNNGLDDSCDKCGLDLRNPIHRRANQ